MTAVQERIIEAGPGGRFTEDLRELRSFRSTLLAFTERHVRVKYKQAVLGVGWAVIQPLAFVGIMAVTLGRVKGLDTYPVKYSGATLAAYVPWMFVQGALNFAAVSLITDASLVRRTYFPREIPVLGTILATGLDLAVGLALFYALGATPLFGAQVTAWWLFAPLLAIPLALLTAGVALLISALSVYYRDFRHALPVLVQLWLFASPVAYAIVKVPPDWRTPYLILNPAAGIFEAFKSTLAIGTAPQWGDLGISCAGSVIIAFVGYRFFKRRERLFAEVV
ncbi:MAG: ABC transporter permease [Actinomycetota bacterium]